MAYSIVRLVLLVRVRAIDSGESARRRGMTSQRRNSKTLFLCRKDGGGEGWEVPGGATPAPGGGVGSNCGRERALDRMALRAILTHW